MFEVAMLGMKMYFDGLMNKGPEWVNAGLEGIEKRITTAKTTRGLGVMGIVMAENMGPVVPNRMERR